MEIIDFKATKRTLKGNGPARRLRMQGQTPAVVYGAKMAPEMLAVNTLALSKALKAGAVGQTLYHLSIENDEKQKRTVMIKELQADPVSRTLLHVDFYEVDMTKKLLVNVPVVPVGDCKGVELGGVLQVIRRELEILCYPSDIPESIEVDITNLDVGESIHVEDIPLAGDIEIPADVNFTVITVLIPKVAEEEEETEGEEGAVEGEEGAAEEASAESEE